MVEGNQKNKFSLLIPSVVSWKEEKRERDRERERRQGGLTGMHTTYAIKKDPITLQDPQCII